MTIVGPLGPAGDRLRHCRIGRVTFKGMVHKLPDGSHECYSLRLSASAAHCHASRDDGNCLWWLCPQVHDGEPARSGRHCPLDLGDPYQ